MKKKIKQSIFKLNFHQESSTFNVLILEPMGVNKSSLINTILKLDERRDDKGPIYELDKMKGLKFYDNQRAKNGIKEILTIKKI